MFSTAVALLVVASAMVFQQSAALPAAPAAQPSTPAAEAVTLRKIFHLAGIPTLARDARVDLTLTEDRLVFKYRKDKELVVPYERLRHAQVLTGERHHEGGTAVAAAAGGVVGALLILRKRKMDTVVFEYVNERGGRMGVVVQVPEKQGATCGEWLARHGVEVKGS